MVYSQIKMGKEENSRTEEFGRTIERLGKTVCKKEIKTDLKDLSENLCQPDIVRSGWRLLNFKISFKETKISETEK